VNHTEELRPNRENEKTQEQHPPYGYMAVVVSLLCGEKERGSSSPIYKAALTVIRLMFELQNNEHDY